MKTTTNFSPFARLTGHTWESYLDSINSTHKSTINKKIKNLHKTFDVKFELAETEKQRKDALELFISLHLARWSGDGGSKALDTQELLEFHRKISAIAFERGWLRLYTLILDGSAAATLYIYSYGNVFYFYQTAYNIDYKKYGVGFIILAFAIKAAIAEGVAEFDFLHDDEEYKYLWAREERELIRLELYPPKNIGKIYKHAVVMKSEIKRAISNISSSRL